MNKGKKPYVKPKVSRFELDGPQAVLGSCKTHGCIPIWQYAGGSGCYWITRCKDVGS